MEPGPLPHCAYTTHHLAPYPHPAAEEQEGVTASPEEVPAGPSLGDPPPPSAPGSHPGGSGQIQKWDSQTCSPAQARRPDQRSPVLASEIDPLDHVDPQARKDCPCQRVCVSVCVSV